MEWTKSHGDSNVLRETSDEYSIEAQYGGGDGA